MDVSILSLFKCVCRIILTSCTQAKRARVHPCSRERHFSPSFSFYLPVYSSLTSSSCSWHYDPYYSHTYRCICIVRAGEHTHTHTNTRAKTGRSRGSEWIKSRCMLGKRRSASQRFSSKNEEWTQKFLTVEVRELVDSLTGSLRSWICIQNCFAH